MLTARVDGLKLISLHLDEARWLELAREARQAKRQGRVDYLVCLGCGGRMHTAKLGPPYNTQYFAHDPGEAVRCALAGGESGEHLALKAKLYNTISATKGWRADLETYFGDVVVDVTASKEQEKDAKPFGFEVQLSKQTAAEVLEREEKRQRWLAGNTWVVRDPVAWEKDVPTIRVAASDTGTEHVVGGPVVYDGTNWVPAEPIPLGRFTRKILSGKIHFAEGVGYRIFDEKTKAKRRPAVVVEYEPGRYAAWACSRAPVITARVNEDGARVPMPRPATTATAKRIVEEFDAHYAAHPEQWPADSWRHQARPF